MRCFITPAEWDRDETELPPEEAHHVLHVLRARERHPIELCDGKGGVAEAEIARIDKKKVLVKILNRRREPQPRPHTCLIQGLARGQKMDWIIQKATELGAAELRAIETEYAVARLPDDRKTQRLERWRRIALNAAKQCGATWLPDLHSFHTLSEALQQASFDLLLLGDLSEESRSLRQVLRQAATPPVERIGLLIGPEGDFTPEEKKRAAGLGAIPVHFGPLTLRTETAALFPLAAIRYEFTAEGTPSSL